MPLDRITKANPILIIIIILINFIHFLIFSIIFFILINIIPKLLEYFYKILIFLIKLLWKEDSIFIFFYSQY
jgi:hypothetical protein